MSFSDTDAKPKPDRHGYSNSDRNSDRDSYIHTDGYSYCHSYGYLYAAPDGSAASPRFRFAAVRVAPAAAACASRRGQAVGARIATRAVVRRRRRPASSKHDHKGNKDLLLPHRDRLHLMANIFEAIPSPTLARGCIPGPGQSLQLGRVIEMTEHDARTVIWKVRA